MTRLVIIDLIPALLQEGRDALEVRDGATDMLERLFSRHRLAAITDAGDHGDMRKLLDDVELDGWFESIGTTVEFGPVISPTVVRRLCSTIGVTPDRAAVVTARPEVGERLRRGGIRTLVIAGPEDLDALDVLRGGPIR